MIKCEIAFVDDTHWILNNIYCIGLLTNFFFNGSFRLRRKIIDFELLPGFLIGLALEVCEDGGVQLWTARHVCVAYDVGIYEWCLHSEYVVISNLNT